MAYLKTPEYKVFRDANHIVGPVYVGFCKDTDGHYYILGIIEDGNVKPRHFGNSGFDLQDFKGLTEALHDYHDILKTGGKFPQIEPEKLLRVD